MEIKEAEEKIKALAAENAALKAQAVRSPKVVSVRDLPTIKKELEEKKKKVKS